MREDAADTCVNTVRSQAKHGQPTACRAGIVLLPCGVVARGAFPSRESESESESESRRVLIWYWVLRTDGYC